MQRNSNLIQKSLKIVLKNYTDSDEVTIDMLKNPNQEVETKYVRWKYLDQKQL